MPAKKDGQKSRRKIMKKNKIINGIKKIAVSALALTMVFAMTACGGSSQTAETTAAAARIMQKEAARAERL